MRPSLFSSAPELRAVISVEQARDCYQVGSNSTAHGFDHVLRVTALADRIAQAEGADREIVHAAALLHDIASSGPDRDSHHLIGAERAQEILLAMGHPVERVAAVAHCIRAHRFRRASPAVDGGVTPGPEHAPQTLEAQCVFDADKLDAIGAVGVARAFAHSSELGQPLWGEVSPEFRAGARTGEPHTTHHEFYHKLLLLRGRMYTPTGRLLAAERHQYLVAFFNRMAREVAGEA